MHKLSRDEVITQITRIRGRNNRLWMSLLSLALKAKPRKAKKIIRGITRNDQEVSKWLGRI